MAFCKFCGREIGDKSVVNGRCDDCAARLALLNGRSSAGAFEYADIVANMWAACLSYIPLGFLLHVFFASDSKYASYHGRRGFRFTVLTLVMTVIGLAARVAALLEPVSAVGESLCRLFCALLMLVWVCAFFRNEYHALTAKPFGRKKR